LSLSCKFVPSVAQLGANSRKQEAGIFSHVKRCLPFLLSRTGFPRLSYCFSIQFYNPNRNLVFFMNILPFSDYKIYIQYVIIIFEEESVRNKIEIRYTTYQSGEFMPPTEGIDLI